jgi:GAF domain
MVCPYCTGANSFKAMVAHGGGGWFMCSSCSHVVTPNNPLFKCTCAHCSDSGELTRQSSRRLAVRPAMSTHSTLDRESFQELLASIFAVQESQVDIQSLSAMVEIQQSITSGDLPADVAIQLIANCTRNVANATGVAIGLLKGDHLVYWAGSGSAARYTGRHTVATISVAAGTDTSREIIKVENAQADARIAAAICRQFGAEALLILPIYHDRAVAGVLEVLFREAHAFQDGEVRAYRLIAGLVGKVVSHAAEREQRKASAAELSTVPDPLEQITSQMRKLRDDDVPGTANNNAIYQACRGAVAVARELPALGQRVWAATMIKERVKSVPLHVRRWNVAAAAVATALVIICWIAYSDHRLASPLGASALHKSNHLDRQAAFVPVKPVPANSMFKPQTRPIAREGVKDARHGFKRVKVGENEVDYIAQDVTIRYFTHELASQRVRVGDNQFDIGEDVTVRYFASKPSLVSATRPLASVVQPVDRSVTVPEKVVSPKLTR